VDAEELVAAGGGDDAELAPERDKKTDDETNAPGGGFELDVAENPGLGCAGAAALAKLVAYGKIRALRMETCGVGEAGARALGDALASRRCALTALDLSRNFLGAGGVAAAADGLARGAAAGAARLRALHLGHNAFGCAGAAALARAERASDAFGRLETLDAPGNGMGPEGIAALARGVLSAHGAPRLRELRLQGNPLGAAGARALARASLALSDGDDWTETTTYPYEATVKLPSKARRATHGSLRVLGLGSAKLGALRHVSALDLSANDVGESGAALPVSGRDVVRGGFSHDRADVEAGTRGGDAGRRTAAEDEDEDDDENASNALASLARDLAAAPALRRLDLGYNSLGDAGARVVAAAVASRRAPDARGAFALDLRRNSIGDAGAAALARALSAAAAAGDAGDVLSSVDLRSNAIGEEGLEALRAHVASGRVASNYMPTRWATRREPAPAEREAPEPRGLAGREEGATEVEVAA
jgi:Ran GTPase-activating protein (RanGAP) involved in mRNA processing and transport